MPPSGRAARRGAGRRVRLVACLVVAGAVTGLATAPPAVAQAARAGSGVVAEVQREPGLAAPAATSPASLAAPTAGWSSGAGPDDAPRAEAAWWTPLASAALPGAGQAVLGQDRFVAYMAVEGYFWLRYFADRREASRERNAYRALANDVARAYFSEEKPVGDFAYYERMEQFIESGVYDMVPGGPLQPETDTTTYNGTLWLLARRTYWTNPDLPPEEGSPAYLRAEALYRERAITPEFRWSWRDAQLEQDLYRRTISRSNEAFRRSVQDLGVVLANHVLSTVDAYVAVRLQRTTPSGEGYGVAVTVPWEISRPMGCGGGC